MAPNINDGELDELLKESEAISGNICQVAASSIRYEVAHPNGAAKYPFGLDKVNWARQKDFKSQDKAQREYNRKVIEKYDTVKSAFNNSIAQAGVYFLSCLSLVVYFCATGNWDVFVSLFILYAGSFAATWFLRGCHWCQKSEQYIGLLGALVCWVVLIDEIFRHNDSPYGRVCGAVCLIVCIITLVLKIYYAATRRKYEQSARYGDI